MERVDAFAHVLLPKYYNGMLELGSSIPETYSFTKIESLKNMDVRRELWNKKTRQIISFANINAEDYAEPVLAAKLCRDGNQELIEYIKANSDMFPYGVGMAPFNNIDESIKILDKIDTEISGRVRLNRCKN